MEAHPAAVVSALDVKVSRHGIRIVARASAVHFRI